MNKISALLESWESSLLSTLSVWGHSEKLAAYDPEESSHHSWDHDPRYPASYDSCEKSLSVVGKATSMSSARAVWTKTDPAVPILCTQWSHRGEVMMGYVTLGKSGLREVNGAMISPAVQACGLWRDKAVRKPWTTRGQREGAGRWDTPSVHLTPAWRPIRRVPWAMNGREDYVRN